MTAALEGLAERYTLPGHSLEALYTVRDESARRNSLPR